MDHKSYKINLNSYFLLHPLEKDFHGAFYGMMASIAKLLPEFNHYLQLKSLKVG
jgi:hypothetical protein